MIRPSRAQASAMVTVPAPIGGWNARDALSAMDRLDAVELVNFFPKPDKVVSRGGHTAWCTTLGGQVETLMEWRGPTSRKFLAIANKKIWDISTTGTPTSLLTGLTSSRFQHTTMSTGTATYLVITDGASGVREYDGTTWTTPTLTGVTSANLIHVNNYRGRLFFVEKDSLRAWYLDAGAIQGTVKKLDLTRDAKRGGYLVAQGTWTQDSGEGGTDDLAVFVTSEGEVIVYQGSDPSSATSWAQVGVYQVGKPLGRRCMLRYGSDLCLLLQDGFFPISSLLQTSVQSPALALSDKIRNAFVGSALAKGDTWGWDAFYHPQGQRVIVNVPNDSGGYDQYVMNSITKAWCKFTNINATCWGMYNSRMYCGKADGLVYLCDNGNLDVTAPISISARQAYTDLGVPGALKYHTMFRPRMGVDGKTTISGALDFDYTKSITVGGSTSMTSNGAVWDVGLWNVSLWSRDAIVIAPWFTFGGIGRVASCHISANSSSELAWYDTDYLIEPGGVL